jgi:phenylpropionate dioxygenase-like ring-hydroxylating dioxygenase large terminal subunit
MTEIGVSPWQRLFERLVSELDQPNCPDWEVQTNTLDPKIYYDLGRFEAEHEHLFRRLPLCVGHVDQLAEPGAVLAVDLCGMPLLMARGADRVLRVFLNVCRHRGARLIAQQGEVCRRRNFVCPYHAWTYRLDGSLAGLPRAEAFPDLDRHLLGLRELPSTIRHGLIWAKLDPASDGSLDIASYLGELDRDLNAIGLAHHRFYRQHAVRRATNWKLIVDAFLEVYHVRRLHSATLGPFFAGGVSVSDAAGHHLRFLAARDTTLEIRTLPPESWSPQRHATLVHFVFPNSIFVYHPDYISHLGMYPDAADQTLFVHTMLIPEMPTEQKAEDHWRRSFELIDTNVFNSEDLVMCEQIQRGLRSGANEALIVGRLEQNLCRFHASIEAALEADPRAKVPQTPLV